MSKTNLLEIGVPEDSQQLIRLIYVSVAAPNMGSEQIEHILVKASKRNEIKGLTGMLIYDEGQFWQVLEGPLDSVMSTFDDIRSDKRHSDVTTLVTEDIAKREFKTFRMGTPGNVRSFNDPELHSNVNAALAREKVGTAREASQRLVRGFSQDGQWYPLIAERSEG
ncbi:hypothetical protein B9057_05125 [Aestuarium zhoushanense]|nr:hypothetical protein B9057_05125 [Aestuarium zhoushanense]